MELIGQSDLWVEKYRPQSVKDLILPAHIKSYLQKIVDEKDVPNMLLASTAGKGKTSTAFAICNDIGADVLYINGSLENDINTVRYKVQQFASTSSFSDGKKVVILDEADRMTSAQEALKALIEQTEANCRFIITTNNLAKIIEPIKSRCHFLDYNFSSKESQSMMTAYFKRICWILDNEKVKYEKKILAEFIKKVYPDLRKTLHELQKFVKMYDEVNESIFSSMDGALLGNLITEMKNRKFNNMRKIAAEIDPTSFYMEFYLQIDKELEDSCKPDIIILLGKYAYEASLSVAPELSAVACATEIMKCARWK